MRTISPNKLEKHLKALNTRHTKLDTQLNELLAEPASSINSAEAITTLKRKKCTLKTEISRVEALLKAPLTASATPAPAQEEAPLAEALPDDTILIFTQQPAHNLQAVAA